MPCAFLAALVTVTLGTIGATGALAHPAVEQAQWQLQTPPQQPPPGAAIQSMAPDPANGTVVLYATVSTSPGAWSDSTWTWDGSRWTQQHPAHNPPGRENAALAYDPSTRGVVLFGGMTGVFPNLNYLGDTWTWDGRDWTRRLPKNSPSRRATNAATDPAGGGVLVQGGVGYGHLGGAFFYDTWRWNGRDWIELAPRHHPDGDLATLAADPATHTVVAFGGAFPYPQLFGSTWTWDGHDWTQHHPANAPSARIANGLAYDPAIGRVVLFGGATDLLTTPLTTSDETWTWDGVNWTQQDTSISPPKRTAAAMATDPRTCAVVLFGGFDGPEGDPAANLGDTWLYSSDPQVPDTLSEHRAGGQHHPEVSSCSATEGGDAQ
jgi:hypothetical protein